MHSTSKAEKPHTDTYLWAIHGNLQQPEVWRPFTAAFFLANGAPLPMRLENLWTSTAKDFWTWTDAFCAKVATVTNGIPQWLIGYSQGGRLAWHAVLKRPDLWAGVIVVAADTGVQNDAERAACLANDQRWGQRFLAEDWSILTAEWDAQSVFGGRANAAPRIAATFDRHAIADLFMRFSKGRQEDLLPQLRCLNRPPILFLSGQEDPKYCRIGNHLAVTCPVISHITVPNAAHRVIWENPLYFQQTVQQFLQSTSRYGTISV